LAAAGSGSAAPAGATPSSAREPAATIERMRGANAGRGSDKRRGAGTVDLEIENANTAPEGGRDDSMYE